ncbi:MAG TPA: hypothetical protein PLY32_02610 [Salinivirgaceae bacterium]|nr:hypothetical protein [Salinivirgaceae bacterium]HQA75989.1 hypothetical protein [Salinivirgaceae bacterium]
MEISLQNTKLELIQWLTTLEDREIIQKILDLKNCEDWWDKISEDEKKSIEKGISDANLGKLNSHDKAREIYGKWL